VLLDIWLQGSRLDGLQLLEIIKQQHGNVPVVMISGHGNIDTAMQATKLGAFDFLEKPVDLDRLLHFVLTCVTAGQALGFNRALLLLVDHDRRVIEGRMGVGPGSGEEAARIWNDLSRNAPTLEDVLARYAREGTQPSARMTEVARGMRVPLEGEAAWVHPTGSKPYWLGQITKSSYEYAK